MISHQAFHYPKLVEKIIKLDTTMTTEEYRNLYYGFIFNDDYKPCANTSQYDELLKISNSDKELTKKDYTKYISLAEKSLIEFPIDLRLMNMLAYVYSLDGQKKNLIDYLQYFKVYLEQLYQVEMELHVKPLFMLFP